MREKDRHEISNFSSLGTAMCKPNHDNSGHIGIVSNGWNENIFYGNSHHKLIISKRL